MDYIPFNRPYMTGRELHHISLAHEKGHLSGDGPYSKKCEQHLERTLGVSKCLLTHSCTSALEMAAVLLRIGPGDEFIVPNFTFVSSANAFVQAGAKPVFADVSPDTLNIAPRSIAEAITSRTKAIVVVHYAGVSCDMDAISAMAQEYGIPVVEDAAQGIMASYKGKALGSISSIGTLSFHETKNVISGEGGAILLQDKELASRAEIVREKGTNRREFFRGQVDKYTWVDRGSSYLPSDILAAFLWPQLEEAQNITSRRMRLWESYHSGLEEEEAMGLCRRPIIPSDCIHNAHMYYLLLPNEPARNAFIDTMRLTHNIQCVFHYVPLHSTPMGQSIGRPGGGLQVSTEYSSRLVRLPLWLGLEEHMERVLSATKSTLRDQVYT